MISLILTPLGSDWTETAAAIANDRFLPEYELIVVDNQASQRQRRHQGVCDSRGSLLLFLESPHRFSPGWLANLVLASRHHPGWLICPLIADLDNGELSYGWQGWERSFCARHLNRREPGPDGRVPATGGQVLLVPRAVYEQLDGFNSDLFGSHSDLVEFSLRAARHGFLTRVEHSAVVWQRFAGSYAEPVSWAEVGANQLLMGFLQDGEAGLKAARRCARWRPDYQLARTLFEERRRRARVYPPGPQAQKARAAPDLVSVVIAAHNEGISLQRTVECLRDQDLEVEMVLIDDGSDDGSFDFLQHDDFRRDGRIRSYRFEDSVGCIQARHRGVLLAAGAIVLFLDGHMALLPQAVRQLQAALERAGPLAAVVPDVAVLDGASWSIGPSTGQVFSIDEKLLFIWESPRLPGGLVPIGGGCCLMLRRALYHQLGGFDLALRRWGSEFTDLCLKLYSAGGCCYWESEVRVGHLFRSSFPYAIEHADILYNRLRTAYIHFSPEVFERFRALVCGEPGAEAALSLLQEHRPALERRRMVQAEAAVRHPDWFVQTFLPGLMEEPVG